MAVIVFLGEIVVRTLAPTFLHNAYDTQRRRGLARLYSHDAEYGTITADSQAKHNKRVHKDKISVTPFVRGFATIAQTYATTI